MRTILSVAAAAAAICAMSVNLAAAEPTHVPGGPIQEAGLCWAATNNDNGFGYWKECAPVQIVHHKKK
jgi:hypothetical protein